MADNIISNETPLDPNKLDKAKIWKIIDSGKFHPVQFEKDKVDKTLSQEMKVVNSNPEVKEEFFELEKPNELSSEKDAKRVRQLMLAHDNLPLTWVQIYGSRSAQEVFDEEKKSNNLPPQSAAPNDTRM